jgi:hypothetical protein
MAESLTPVAKKGGPLPADFDWQAAYSATMHRLGPTAVHNLVQQNQKAFFV